MDVVWHNGKFVKFGAARINVLSHALHYGTGVFEGIRSYSAKNGAAIFRLEDHIQRFFRSAAALKMALPYSKKIVTQAIKKIIALNGFPDSYIRPLAFYGEGKIVISPRDAAINLVIASWPRKTYLLDKSLVSLGVSPFIRFHPKSVVPAVKICGYYAMSAVALLEAQARHFDECLLLDHKGFVAEGSVENIFMVKNGKLFTPKPVSILPGITRASVITIAKNFSIPLAEKNISLKELKKADEVFLTGTAVEITPVGKIDLRRIGNGEIGPLTKKIKSVYDEVVQGKIARYRRWLTFV
ncbi:MAG: branched-chain amino acid transaminase [Patescibacteria group bacterium]